MKRPILNLDEVVFDDVEENGPYTSSRGRISDDTATVDSYHRERF
jgi:hypothetical protein